MNGGKSKFPTIIDLMSDPDWFRDSFAGDSWDTWKAVLKASRHLPMTDRDFELFREVAERDPPTQPVRELICICGRRGGKDSVASLICVETAVFNEFTKYLRPGERATCAILAVDRVQARICWRYIDALFEHPILRKLVDKKTDGVNGTTLELKNQVDITILTLNYRSIRGRSIACGIGSEVCFWRDENGANPDVEVYQALEPALATLPGSMLMLISSPYRRTGLLYDKFREHYGVNDPDVLVVKGSSRAFNPTIDQRVVDRAMKRDPVAARSEYLAEWRDDIGAYIDSQLIELATDRGLLVRPPLPDVDYLAFTDVSGGVTAGDSFTLAISHNEEDNLCILDCLVEILPPFNADSAVAQMAGVLKSYGLQHVTGDRWGAMWVQGAFASHGITYTPSERDRSTIYSEALPLFTSGRVRLLDNPKLQQQFAGLERRVSPGGKDRIDHGRAGHDDNCNAVAGALVLANQNESKLAEWYRIAEQMPDREAIADRLQREQRGEVLEPIEPPAPWVGHTSHVIVSGEPR